MALSGILKSEKIIGFWRDIVATKIGAIWGRLSGLSVKSAKATWKWMRANKALTAIAATGVATAAGFALSRSSSHASDVDDKLAVINRDSFSHPLGHKRTASNISQIVRSIDPELLDDMTSYDKQKLAINLAISIGNLLMPIDDLDFEDYFVTTLLSNVALMRTGFILLQPEDHSHLIGFINDQINSLEFQKIVDSALVPLSISIADNPVITIDKYA